MNFLGVYVLNAGLKRLLRIGVDRVNQHVSSLVDKLYEGLTDLGYTVATPQDRRYRCHSLSLKMSDAQAGYRYFQENGVFLSFSGGRFVRVSVAPFTIEEDVQKLLDVARNCPVR